MLPTAAFLTDSCVLSLMLIEDQSLLSSNKVNLLQKHPQCRETNGFQVLGEILKNVVNNLTLSCVKAKPDSRILHSLKLKTHMFGFFSVPPAPRQILWPSHPRGSAPQHPSWPEPLLQLHPGSALPDPATLLSSLQPTLTLQPIPTA